MLVTDTGIDMSLLPPCRSSFSMHALRANYVAYLWKQSHVNYPDMPSPIGSGWKLDASGNIDIEWNWGEIMPQDLIDVMAYHCCADDDLAEAPTFVCSNSIAEDCEIDNILDIVFEADD